jgi:hypothetical protein
VRVSVINVWRWRWELVNMREVNCIASAAGWLHAGQKKADSLRE